MIIRRNEEEKDELIKEIREMANNPFASRPAQGKGNGDLMTGWASGRISADTNTLCASEHKIKASITGNQVGKDYINIEYRVLDSSGATTKLHGDDGYLHKMRITIKNKGNTVYQQDLTGDDSGEYIQGPRFLINKEGKWTLHMKQIATGDCAKNGEELYFSYFTAKKPPQEPQEDEEEPINPNDLTPLLSVGLIGLAGLTVAKLLRGKRKKKAETFEAQNSPEYEATKKYIDEILEEGIAGFKRNPIEYDLLDMGNGTIEATINTGKGAKKLFNKIKITSQIYFPRIEGSRGFIFDIYSLAPDERDWETYPARITFRYKLTDSEYEEGMRKRKSRRRRRAETFEAPKKPVYETVMEIIKQGLYEPNSEQYKIMKKWESQQLRRLYHFWNAYAYLQIQNEIPAEVKQRKIINQMRWVKRSWNKIKHSGMLDDKDFARAFKRARKKYGVNYEQEGFPPIPTNWLMYEDKLFYYETTGALDKRAIITSTAVYSIMDEQAKKAFANLETNKKRGLLKQDKKIYFGAEAPKKFNYKQIIYDTFYGDGDEEIKKYQEEITEQDNPWFPISYYSDEKKFDEKDTKRYLKGMKKFIESHYLYIQPNIARFASFTINGKVFLAFKFSEGKEYYITSKEKWLETAKHDLRTSDQPLPYAQIKGIIRLLEKGKYQDFRQAMIRNNVRFPNVLNRGVVLNLINVQMREKENNE